TNRVSTCDGHFAFSVDLGIVACDVDTATAAANREFTFLSNGGVITCDLGAGRALAIDGGFAGVVGCGFVAGDAGASAAVADGIVTVVVYDRLVAV
ncbi:hypothetical protein I8744_27565, partial [Escherichia coli]|nr:hypothetical protein [Escherichia coli]